MCSLRYLVFYSLICCVFQAIAIVLNKHIHIHQWAFQGLTELEILKIDKCILSSPPPLIHIQHNLSKLSVTNANLSSIPDTYFSGCHKLRKLVFSYNHLSFLPDLSAISDTLVIIQLDHNTLIDVGSLQDLAFPNLRFVHLGHNNIYQLDIKRLVLPRLHTMDVSHNLVQEFDHPKFLVPNSSRETRVSLDLTANPWFCDEHLSWLLASASQRVHQYIGIVDLYWNAFAVHVINAQAMICYMPPTMRGKQAIHMGRY